MGEGRVADALSMAALPLPFRVADLAAPGGRSMIAGMGEMARLVREHLWAETPLGPMDGWSETLLAAVNLVLASPLPSSVYWGPWMVLVYNEKYRQFMADRHPAALGKPGEEVWKEAWHIVGPQIEHTLRTGESFHGENFLVPIEHEGRITDHYWNYSFSPVYDPSTGNVLGVYNTSIPVTESYLAVRERDRLAQRLHQVLDSMSEGVVFIGRDWRFTYLNAGALAHSGPYQDLLGKNIWEALPKLVYEGSPNVYHYHRAMDFNEPSEFESYYPEPLNHWMYIQVRPAPDGIVLFTRDITEEKRAAAALEKAAADLAASEEELRWTIALSFQMPWTADDQGKLLSVDDGLEVSGVNKEQMLGDRWIDMIHPEDAPAMASQWAHCVATGEVYDFEHRIRTGTGEYRWHRARAYPRLDSDGKIVKWYGHTENIHARKQAEEALRTTEKLAAVGRLATSIAHEINNPLEAVTNLLYLARTSDDMPLVLDYIRTAEQELHRASVITNQTLRFQRQSSGAIPLDCEDLIDNCLAVFQGKLQNSSVSAEKRVRAVRPVTCFDGEIRQVFLNLVGNAIDAMQPLGGRLLIRTREATRWVRGDRGIMLTVADTGSGMSPEVQKKLFAPFFTTKGLNGTGLGLWVSQGIVARHHGTLRLRSRLRREQRRVDDRVVCGEKSGTVFTLFLPFHSDGLAV